MRVQHLSGGQRHASPAGVVASLGAMQAQEYAEAKWSLAQRMEGEPTEAELDAAFDRGEIVRTHILRPTWHFVAPEDLAWTMTLSAPRVHQANRYWYRQAGLDDALLQRGSERIAAALAGGEALTRRQLAAELAGAGMELEGMALGYVVHFAELECLICSGPRRGKQHTYMLVADRVPPTPERTREESLAELARRYFGGHGPATVADFSWWSGLTVTDCRAAIELAGEHIHPLNLDDGREWYSPPRPARVPRRTGVHLIPTYDELGVAFQDVRMAFARQPPEGAITRPLLIDGVAVGGWRRTIGSREVVVEVALLRKLSDSESDELSAAADRFGRFLELDAKLVTSLIPA